MHRVSLDPKAYPRLSWSWKIVRTIGKGDERTKAGDDYAARVYVVFPSVLFWKTRAVNYIWANRLSRPAAIAGEGERRQPFGPDCFRTVSFNRFVISSKEDFCRIPANWER
ncbi:MAG: DUF3047 domain-containing protein [Deltaproteobacteria bacterium]|nr:DUF3047 domain-containing protein [Deltaproteobacteria bacterium]